MHDAGEYSAVQYFREAVIEEAMTPKCLLYTFSSMSRKIYSNE